MYVFQLPTPFLLTGPLSGGSKGQPGGSDSGISIEYDTAGHQASGPCVLKDLPFDMPKLRRRLAAARSCPSTSDSSLASSGDRYSLQQPVPLVSASLCTNPAISRVQASEVLSGTSSSNSSLWEGGSSAASSVEGTPRKGSMSARGSLVLDLGCSALAMTGEEVDVTVPLTKQSWYHGKINRTEAEKLLRCETEGSYLVRSIDTPRLEYSLALKAASGYMHLKIQFHAQGNGFKMGRGDQLFPSVPHIIHHHSIHRLPIKGAEHMFLKTPIISETL
ncbi:SH2 domain [Trinorchestia longiramus]|nr:SH2 domain [Trinorchestia longiramus]